MPRIQFSGNTDTAPTFIGDFLSRDYLLAGGVKVTPAAFAANAAGKRYVAAGSLIGRTFAERTADTAFGAAADTDDEVFIVAYDIYDLNEINDAEVLRHGTLIKENFLPGWADVSAALKAKVRASYQTTTGAGGSIMPDISGPINQANTDGRFAQIASDPFTQFGTKARTYIGAELMPERTVEDYMFRDEAFQFLSTVANDESRHSPPTMQKMAQRRGDERNFGRFRYCHAVEYAGI